MSERKLPGDELLLDGTILAWEHAARQRFGIIANAPQVCESCLIRKVRTRAERCVRRSPHSSSCCARSPRCCRRRDLESSSPGEFSRRIPSANLSQARTKKEQTLEFCQAMIDLREVRYFWVHTAKFRSTVRIRVIARDHNSNSRAYFRAVFTSRTSLTSGPYLVLVLY